MTKPKSYFLGFWKWGTINEVSTHPWLRKAPFEVDRMALELAVSHRAMFHPGRSHGKG